MKKFFVSIFVPENDYFTKKFDDIRTNLTGRLKVDTRFIDSLNIKSVEPVAISYSLNGNTYTFLDFSFIKQNISYIRSILGTFLYFFLGYYSYRQIIKLIGGFDDN